MVMVIWWQMFSYYDELTIFDWLCIISYCQFTFSSVVYRDIFTSQVSCYYREVALCEMWIALEGGVLFYMNI